MRHAATQLTNDIRLSELPSHWRLIPVRGIVDHSTEKNTGTKSDNYLSVVAGRGVLLYKDKGDVGNKKPDDLEKCKVVKKGNLVINSMNYAIGSFGMSSHDGVCSPVYIILNPIKSEVHPSFALRIFEDKSFQTLAASFGNGILEHRAAIGWDSLKGMKVGLPPVYEQRQIASYLNRETAKIDRLIAKQERLIELLHEKRQAVISRAVTKGLDPNVKMKDSGVEWLGEVPQYWKVVNLGLILEALGDIDHYMPESVDEGIPYVMTGDLAERASTIDFADCKKVTVNDFKKLSKRLKTSLGDVVMARYATIGTTTYIDIAKDMLFSYSCVTLKPNPKVVSGLYIFYYLKSEVFQTGIKIRVNTNTQSNIGIADLQKIKITVPPLAEQQQIVNALEAEIHEISSITEKAKKSISLLKEHRQALISAAVTGKIDVRNLVSDEEVAVLERVSESELNIDEATGDEE